MFPVNVIFCFYFVQLSSAFNNGLFGYVFGYQKLCFCRCGIAQTQPSSNVRSGRLLGGEPSTPHQFPWLATVNIGSQTIGGSLISDRHVVTAASPLYGVSAGQVSVTLGAHDRCGIGADPALNSSVESVVLHPAYSPTNMHNDICLVKLRHVVPFSQFISPVCLPIYDDQESEQVAWIASWAEDSPISACTPRVATLPMLPSRACLKAATDPTLATSDKGCLGPVGAKSIICKTDVGAPVLTRWSARAAYRLVGVMSSVTSCYNQSTPLYTKVINHVAWIYDYIRSDCQCF